MRLMTGLPAGAPGPRRSIPRRYGQRARPGRAWALRRDRQPQRTGERRPAPARRGSRPAPARPAAQRPGVRRSPPERLGSEGDERRYEAASPDASSSVSAGRPVLGVIPPETRSFVFHELMQRWLGRLQRARAIDPAGEVGDEGRVSRPRGRGRGRGFEARGVVHGDHEAGEERAEAVCGDVPALRVATAAEHRGRRDEDRDDRVAHQARGEAAAERQPLVRDVQPVDDLEFVPRRTRAREASVSPG